MGTEIHNNAYFSGSYSTRDESDSLGDNIWALYNDHKAFKTDLYCHSFLRKQAISGYSGYEKEQLRQTILKHELIFKYQIEELHRLYKRQRDVINEIKRTVLYQPSDFPFADLSFRRPPTLYTNNIRSTLSHMKKELTSTPFIAHERVTLKECEYPESKHDTFEKSLLNFELPFRVCVNNGRDETREVNMHIGIGSGFESDLCLRRVNGMFDLNEPVQNEENHMSRLSVDNKPGETIFGTKIDRVDKPSLVSSSDVSNNKMKRKRTIFGVEISEENDNEIGKHVLPSNSKKIFGFSIVVPHTSPSSTSFVPKCASNGDHILTSNGSDLVADQGLCSYISNLKLHIDLNLSTNEDETPLILPLPEAVLKIASVEIDLEAPAVIESDSDLPPESDFSANIIQLPPILPLQESKHNEELDRAVAEVIVAMSSSLSDPLPDFCDESLGWFADLVCSYDDDGDYYEESFFISNEMDCFEFMTLNLKETEVHEYLDESPIFLDTPKDEEKTELFSSRRPTRGQGKRGKQRKDFQRDVLPGIVSLARHEVAEDMQSFEELFKATCLVWQPKVSRRKSGKSDRGRRRLDGCDETPTPVCELVNEQLSFSVVEETGVTVWGKRMRRLPRRRCRMGDFTRT